MFTEIIAVYSEITAVYINKTCGQNSENIDAAASDTCRQMFLIMLENISLAPTNCVGNNQGTV